MKLPGRFDKKVIIDTNVILFDAMAITKFLESDIYIPFSVIEEIDRFKRDLGENGRNARHFSRFIDVIRSKGPLAEGVELEKSKSYVYVNTDHHTAGLPEELDANKADNRILATAITLQRQFPEAQVRLVSKDINLRIKADVFNVHATDYEPESTQVDEAYKGIKEINVEPQKIDEFYKNKEL